MKNENTNTESTAAAIFPHLIAEIKADNERRKADIAHFIRFGWLPSWGEEHHNEPDRGLKQNSTETRWTQYQRGELDREKAVELAIRRASKQIDKKSAEYLERLERAAAAPDFDDASIIVTWARSRTWGHNPTAEVLNPFDRRAVGHASGCGYDKESTAIGEALNQIPAALRVLYELGEKALERGDSPRSRTACTGYNWSGCIAYASGYGVLPYYEGGCGSSCFWEIFNKAGYTVKHAGSGKAFDCWTVEKAKAQEA